MVINGITRAMGLQMGIWMRKKFTNSKITTKNDNEKLCKHSKNRLHLVLNFEV